MNGETVVRNYRVNRREIGYLKFILEAYDNLAMLTTLDPQRGIVQLRIAPGCEKVVAEIVNGLSAIARPVAEDGRVVADDDATATPFKRNDP